MDIHSKKSQRAVTIDGKECNFGPLYQRSSPLKKLNIKIKPQTIPSWVRRDNTYTGWFTFDSTRDEGVIDVCKNHGPMYEVFTLEKVENENRGEGKLPENKEFYPALHRMYKQKKNWNQDFKFRGLASFHPYLMEWTDTVLVAYRATLLKANIYGAVAVSAYPYERCKDVWRAFCELWSPLTNTLHHGIGEMGISLYDLKVIGGLPAMGIPYEEFLPLNKELLDYNVYSPTVAELLRIHAKLCNHLGESRVTWTQWIHYFYRGDMYIPAYGEFPNLLYKKGQEFRESMHELPLEVSEEGMLVAYLALWLSRFVFPYGNSVVRPETFYMASLMAKGNIVSLAPSVLGYIYQGMGEIALHPNNPGSANPNFPIHYVLGWLGEHFPSLYRRRASHEYPTEYPHLAKYAGVRGEDLSLYAARIVFRNNKFVVFRPTSFDKDKGTEYMDNEDLADKHFEFLIFVRSCLLPVRVGTLLCVQPYYPNRFARQFGYDQGIPTNKLRFNFEQRQQRIELVAKAQAVLLQRNTSALFYIPHSSQDGCCTYWYCGWWVRNSAPYLGLSVKKVHYTLTKKAYTQPEPVFVITNIREPTSGIPGIIKETTLVSQLSQTKLEFGGTSSHANKIKSRPSGDPSSDDKHYKRARYERSSGSDETDTIGTGPPFQDLPIDSSSDNGTSNGNEGLKKPEDMTAVEDELVDYADSEVSLTGEIPEDMTMSIHTMFGEGIQQRTKEYARGLIEDIFQIISSSNSLAIVLSHRSEIETTLGFLQAITNQAKFGQLEVDWLTKITQNIFDMATKYVSYATIIQQGEGLDISLIEDLNRRLEEYTTIKMTLESDLLESSKNLADLKSSEVDVLQQMNMPVN